jgi:hypothetical protein
MLRAGSGNPAAGKQEQNSQKNPHASDYVTDGYPVKRQYVLFCSDSSYNPQIEFMDWSGCHAANSGLVLARARKEPPTSISHTRLIKNRYSVQGAKYLSVRGNCHNLLIQLEFPTVHGVELNFVMKRALPPPG